MQTCVFMFSFCFAFAHVSQQAQKEKLLDMNYVVAVELAQSV